MVPPNVCQSSVNKFDNFSTNVTNVGVRVCVLREGEQRAIPPYSSMFVRKCLRNTFEAQIAHTGCEEQ